MVLKWLFYTLLFENTRLLGRQLKTFLLNTNEEVPFLNVKKEFLHYCCLCYSVIQSTPSVHIWTCTTVPVDATAYKSITQTLILKIKIELWTAQVSTVIYWKEKKPKTFHPLVIIFMDKEAEEKVSWIKYEFTHQNCDIQKLSLFHAQKGCSQKVAHSTFRLFTPLLIPRELPKVNQFWSRELCTFLKVDCMNADCIQAAIVL